MASPASQAWALRAGDASTTSANTPVYVRARRASSNAPPSSTPQPIDRTVNRLRPATDAPATMPSRGTEARGNARRSTPATTTHHTATARMERAWIE
jgi:hypothetical protein